MNTKQAVKLAGGTQEALGAVFDPPLSRQAVSKWGKNIPPLRLYQLKERRPEWFAKVVAPKPDFPPLVVDLVNGTSRKATPKEVAKWKKDNRMKVYSR